MKENCSSSLAALPSGLEEALKGKRVLATGCTGFFGLWTIAALEHVGDCEIEIISSDPERFQRQFPSMAKAKHVVWSSGKPGPFDFGLHMATTSSAARQNADPYAMLAAMVADTKKIAELCSKNAAPLLYVSSGAVYGKRAAGSASVKEEEDVSSAPACADARQIYGHAKRISEAIVASESGLEWTVSRPFAFLGPHLPLDGHFAAGNFLSDACASKPIVINSDGKPERTYMHPADLVAWQLWLMALGPRREALNVGGEQRISIRDLAIKISKLADSPEPHVLGEGAGGADSYVPALDKARSLGLKFSIDLDASISTSIDWLKSSGGTWS